VIFCDIFLDIFFWIFFFDIFGQLVGIFWLWYFWSKAWWYFGCM